MKKIIFIFTIFNTPVFAQSTWFKLLPGFETQNTHFSKGDTIITVGQGNIGTALIILLTYSDLKTGKHYRTDTVDYFEISKDSITSNEYRTPFQSHYDSKELTIGFNYVDTLKGRYRWQSAIFKTYPLEKLPYKLNHDTFNTKIEGFQKIGNNFFAIIQWVEYFGSLGATTNYQLLKLNQSYGKKLIKQEFDAICAKCHSIWYERLLGDNQNQGNLILQQIDQWDWAGLPGSFQSEVIKMDTNGKTIWKCRPNNRDSFNTSAFRMVQKPSGNIICSWNNYYHPPYKSPTGDNHYEDVNDSATVWFAEIDYYTGKVLWRKNIRRYLFSKFTTKEEITRTVQDVAFYEAQIVNNNSIVWVGQRIGGYPEPYLYKYMTIIMKTDLSCNPVWYREHEIFPGDTGDKGMKVFNLAQTPDKGFLLGGVYENQYGQVSGGEFWRKGALLKLDSFGCWKDGCQRTDFINKFNNSPRICKVYPNPAKDKLFIEFPPNQPNGWRITITDVLGKTIQEFNHQVKSIDIINYPTGLFFIHLENINSNQYETHKISIEH